MSRIVVIGAGVGGLAAAVRLAAAGHRVTVCEQAEEVGGKLGVVSAGGYRWDTGPSLLTWPSVLAATLAAGGADLADHLTLRRLDPIARYRFADGQELDAAADLDEFCDRLDAALTPGSGDDWRRLTARAAAMWAVVEQPFLRSALRPAALVTALRSWSRVRTIAPHLTLRGLGRRHLRDPRLRQFLERYATYTGSDPRRAPATLAVIPYLEQRFGAWYVDGGLYRIAEVLATVAQDRGAVIRTGADVRSITVAGGRVAGVELAGGERLPADVVVANCDAAHLYASLLPAPAAARPLRRIRRAELSLSGYVLLLGLTGAAPDVAHHTVLFGRDYDAEFDAIFGPNPRPVPDPTLYVAAPRDTTTAQAGHRAWFVLANAPRHGPVDWSDAAAAEAYGDAVLAVLAERGLDLGSCTVQRRALTPADLQRRTRAVGGAIYGTSSNGARSAFLRPPNTTAVHGLFAVGGSSHPGGGLPLVLLSAEIVAGLVGRPS